MLKGISKSIITFSFSFLTLHFAGFSQEKTPPALEDIRAIPEIKTDWCPEIPKLNHKDILYKQYSEDLQQYYMDHAQQKDTFINFYSYVPSKDDTLFTVAARLNIPYDTIVSINGITSADTKIQGVKLILPTAAGLFILDTGKNKQEKPVNSLEALVQKKFADKLNEKEYFCYNINGRYFIHLPEERLDQTTRAFFLDVKMKTPLDQYWLSSDYGYRPSPFGGEKQFHRGIDMAAPEGTRVYACKSGTVASVIKLDKTFGNYIVIKHVNGLSSIYAHLSKIEVTPGEIVSTGAEIGLVGQTGKVTGPHLHFEIRQNGQPTDPNAYIKH